MSLAILFHRRLFTTCGKEQDRHCSWRLTSVQCQEFIQKCWRGLAYMLSEVQRVLEQTQLCCTSAMRLRLLCKQPILGLGGVQRKVKDCTSGYHGRTRGMLPAI